MLIFNRYVAQVKTQVMVGNAKGGLRGIEEAKHQAKKEKKEKDKAAALLASLFAGAQNLNKNANDEAIKESQKIDLYKDPREGTANMPQDTIITCNHFLDAVEEEIYGWRWTCPNKGVNCQYRHQLPEGYVVLSKKERDAAKKDAEKQKGDTRTIEEIIEEERAALKSDGLTPVTAESFKAWKERRKEKKQ